MLKRNGEGVEVSIVIPNWEGEEVLSANLPSVIRAAAVAPFPVEVLVVDDGSRDRSCQVVRSLGSRLRLVRHEENQGFGRAVGTGARAARGRLLALLNTDVKVAEDFLEPLAAHFEDPLTFGVSPAAENESGRLLPPHVMQPILSYGLFRWRKPALASAAEARARLGGAVPTFFVSGGHSLIRRDRFLELGGFDPIFAPFYYEDTDLSYRAWKRGWRVWFDPASRVVHTSGGTIGRKFAEDVVKRIRFRNGLLLIWKNTQSRFYLFGLHLPMILGRVLDRSRRGDLRSWRGFREALRLLPAALQARRREAGFAKVRDREIFRAVWSGTMRPERAVVLPRPEPAALPQAGVVPVLAPGSTLLR